MKNEKNGKSNSTAFVLSMSLLLCLAWTTHGKNIFHWRPIIWTGGSVCSQNEDLRAVMKTGSELGYNEILWDNASILKLHKVDPKCKANLNGFLAYAKSLGILVTPSSQGQTAPTMVDPNLGEALPSRGAPFIVSGSKALVEVDTTLVILNPGFENGIGKWRTSWKQYYSIDSTTKRSGNVSLRCDDPIKGPYVRMSQYITVRPWRTYELSMYVKSSEIEMLSHKEPLPKLNQTGFAVHAQSGYLFNQRETQGVRPKMDWRLVKCKFNSMSNSRVQVNVQTLVLPQNCFKGTVWFDDVSIREVGLMETTRRSSLPIVVRSKSGQILTEGVDYEVGDQQLAIPATSSLKNGDKLTINWFTKAVVSFRIPETAFCDWRSYQVVRDQIKLEDEWFGTPPVRHMKYGEWKAAGWDPLCRQIYNIEKAGSGPYIGSVARITEQLYREANCNRVASSWHDMFDPYHNSKNTYHTTSGGTGRTGLELTESHVIRNWNNHKPLQSILYFAGLDTTKFLDPVSGQWKRKTTEQRQILNAGYFGGWVKMLAALDTAEKDYGLRDGAVIGMCYQSFQGPSTYGRLEEMKNACVQAGRWGSGPVPVPEATPGCKATDPLTGIASPGKELGDPQVNRVSLATSLGSSMSYSVSQHAHIKLQLIDARGRVVKTLADSHKTAGTYRAGIDAKRISAGVYFATLTVKGQEAQRVTRKMVVFD